MARRTLEEEFSDVMILGDSIGVERTEESAIVERAAFFAGANRVLGAVMDESMSPDERAEALLAMILEVNQEYLRWLERAGPVVMGALRSMMRR